MSPWLRLSDCDSSHSITRHKVTTWNRRSRTVLSLGECATLRISSPEVTSTSASVGDSLIDAFIIFPHWTVIYSGQGSEALSINSSCLPRVRVTSWFIYSLITYLKNLIRTVNSNTIWHKDRWVTCPNFVNFVSTILALTQSLWRS